MSEPAAPSSGDAARVLRTVDLFAMLPEPEIARVAAAGELRRLGQGEVLFLTGDPPDRIHVVLDGVLEIVRTSPDQPEPQPVAYLSRGETIGDMAMLTGSARRSSGRAPEFAHVWTLTRPKFEALTRSLPGYGMQVATMFAKRLEEFINQMRGQARRKELSGHLRFFDLPTVVQTLVSSNQTGILSLTTGEKTWAEVLLRDGAVERARCGGLEGDEAFYQLFLGEPDGEFAFRGVADPAVDRISRVPITLSAMNLLMEAMRLVDELPSVRDRLPEPDRPYQARTDDLRWEDEATLRAAHEILARLREPRPLRDLIGEVPCSTYTLYRIAAELYETGQIA
jgi:CRP-like cAMP-binding protein